VTIKQGTPEAIFWFDPLVWWLGVRLVDERERACDEEVLELGSDRQVYAESILKTCEFCVESPLACVSGVTGANLKKRIVRIMTDRVARKLDFSRKLLLSALGLIGVASPVVFGILHATQILAESRAQNTCGSALQYEVASIKRNKSGDDKQRISFPPNGFTATNITLQMLIRVAYGVEENQISAAPNWLNSENYNVEAKMDNPAVDALRKLSEDQRKLERERMLQVLLADRLHLTLHRETKELPVYALVIAKNGVKLHKSKLGDPYPNGLKGPDGLPGGPTSMRIKPGEVIIQARPVESLAWALSRLLGRTVLDKSGLEGNYDITLQWAPDEGQGGMLSDRKATSKGLVTRLRSNLLGLPSSRRFRSSLPENGIAKKSPRDSRHR